MKRLGEVEVLPVSSAPREADVDASAEIPDAAREWLARIGSKGGKKGGKARLAKLSEEKRREIAYRAAKARWGGRKVP